MSTYGEIEQSKRGWFARNWKRLVCVWLGLVFSVAILVFVTLRSTDAYKLAIAQARSHPSVISRLGEPIKTGWIVSGKVEWTGKSGHADLAIPLSGPKGRGTLYALAAKRAGIWKLDLLQLEVEGDTSRIELLETHAAPWFP